MCVDPLTALALGGGVIGAVGNLQSASATAAADKAQASQAFAQIQQVSNKTTFDIDAANRRFSQHAGAVAAIIGQSGINPASFGAVLDDDAKQHALELATIRQGGDVNKASLKTTANIKLQDARSAKFAGIIGAAGSLIGGGVTAAKIDARNTISGTDDFSRGVTFDPLFG